MRIRTFIGVGIVVSLAVIAGSPLAAPSRPSWHRTVLGLSVEGRQIVAFEGGDPASPRKVLVVGAIHGNEPAGTAVAAALRTSSVPAGVDVWVVPDLNPDGVAAGSRGNAHGVDLNRNFPWRWRRLTGLFFSGPQSLSEPESRIAYRLIRRLRPQVSIWFHQHAGVVDKSGGSVGVEQRFAAIVGLPLARLARYPGSATSWENAALPGTTAFVVELPPGALGPAAARRYARGVLGVARLPEGAVRP
jgi:murein peptide amidase A